VDNHTLVCHAGPVTFGGKEGTKDQIRLLWGQPHSSIANRNHHLLFFGALSDLIASSRVPLTSFIASMALIMRFISTC
jgi:hypothetical protein